jgi:hypothetical protein
MKQKKKKKRRAGRKNVGSFMLGNTRAKTQ